MAEVTFLESKHPIDVCKRCQFVWFDTSEFELFPSITRVEVNHSAALPSKAQEAIAIWKAQQIGDRAAEAEAYSSDGPDLGWKTCAGILGMPVEIDNPVSTTPWLTWTVSLVIAAVSVASFRNLDAAIADFGLVPGEWFRTGGLTLLTSFLLHGGIVHLLGNLYFLLVFGDNVEEFVGRVRFILLLLVATIAGDALHILFARNPEIPVVGASGGISGIITFYALQFPQARIAFMWRAWVYFRWLTFPAFAALILWLCLQGLGIWVQLKGFSNVSSLAHIGGALVGGLFWFAWRKREAA